ncbi:MAG: SCO family protein [Planctomycetaceae bacterium]
MSWLPALLGAVLAASPTPGMPAPMRPTATSLATRPPRQAAGLIGKVAFDQNLDARLPLDLPLRDEEGRAIRLGDLLGKKPALLTLVYYECPMLCNEVLNSLLRSLNALSFEVGDEFDVITVSIDPTETPALAVEKKRRYLSRYGTTPGVGYRRRGDAERGWHFLTAGEPAIERLAGVVGFRYAYDPESKQYAHPAGIVVLTPEGRVSRYFYGISYPVRDLKLALMEASARKIGSPMDQILLMCFHYDPRTGKYNFVIIKVLQFFGVVTLASLGTYMVLMFRRDRRRAALPGGAGV